MILSVIEGIVLCFVLLLVCVINIQNGPVGGGHYYEEPVKRRVIELGLITREQMNKNRGSAADPGAADGLRSKRSEELR